jgi:hypothetical protein
VPALAAKTDFCTQQKYHTQHIWLLTPDLICKSAQDTSLSNFMEHLGILGYHGEQFVTSEFKFHYVFIIPLTFKV